MYCFGLKQIKSIFPEPFTKKKGTGFLSIADRTSKKNANSYRNLKDEGIFLSDQNPFTREDREGPLKRVGIDQREKGATLS